MPTVTIKYYDLWSVSMALGDRSLDFDPIFFSDLRGYLSDNQIPFTGCRCPDGVYTSDLLDVGNNLLIYLLHWKI